MAWTIKFDERALKELKKLDKKAQRDIIHYLHQRITNSGNPRLHGKPLKGKFQGLWRYRVGNYRLVCQIKDKQLQVLVLRAAHRRKIYL